MSYVLFGNMEYAKAKVGKLVTKEDVMIRNSLNEMYKDALFRIHKFGVRVKFGNTYRDIDKAEICIALKCAMERLGKLSLEDTNILKSHLKYLSRMNKKRTLNWDLYRKLRAIQNNPDVVIPSEIIKKRKHEKNKRMVLRMHRGTSYKNLKSREEKPEDDAPVINAAQRQKSNTDAARWGDIV